MTDDGKKPFKDEAFFYWNKFSTYVTFLLAIGTTLGVTTFFAGENKIYSQMLGTASAGIEALLPLP